MVTIDSLENLKARLCGALLSDKIYVVEGTVPVLISVPHAVPHMRDGSLKSDEVNTDLIGMLVQENTGCHLFINEGVDGDPNYDDPNVYKDRLLEYVQAYGVAMVIDLHGASQEREFDFELGTGKSANVTEFPECAKLFASLPELKGLTITIDEFFPAAKPYTVSAFVSSRTGIPCLQIEINRRMRKGDESILLTANALVRYVRGVAARMTLSASERQEYRLLWVMKSDTFMPRNLVTLSPEFKAVFGRNENVVLRFGAVSDEFVVKGLGAPEGCLEITGQMIQRCGGEGYAMVHMRTYSTHKVAKPQAEDIDNVYALLSEDLYEKYKGYDLLEVLNPFDNLRSYFKIKKYEGNVNARTDTVWLSYYQRKLLGLEVPHTLSYNYMLRLQAKMGDEDAAFFKAQYQYDDDQSAYVRLAGNAEASSRLRNIWTSIFDNVRFRGVPAAVAPQRQGAVMERLVGKKSLQLRAARCVDTSEIMDAVFVTKNSSIVLGVSELDYVWLTHEGKSVRAKVVLIEPDDYKRIVKTNGLKSDEEMDMLVCIPAKIRLGLGIYEPGTSVQLERSVKDLFVKNAFAQMMTLLGLFIAVMSLPDIRMLHKALIFLMLSPVIIYSVLAEERNKI